MVIVFDRFSQYPKSSFEIKEWKRQINGSCMCWTCVAQRRNTLNINDILNWCTLFADNIVLVDELRDGVNMKLERW